MVSLHSKETLTKTQPEVTFAHLALLIPNDILIPKWQLLPETTVGPLCDCLETTAHIHRLGVNLTDVLL